jgi:hypothetical protein
LASTLFFSEGKRKYSDSGEEETLHFRNRQGQLWAVAVVFLLSSCQRLHADDRQGWEQFSNEKTLEVLTLNTESEEHWSTFWLVVLDHQLYLRLGSRGAERVQCNTTNPFISVKIAGQRFDNVRVIKAPEMTQQVAAVLAQKYWSDLLIRWFPHPLTVRLER